MDKYVLLRVILKNHDIYNPLWMYKIKNIETQQVSEVAECEMNKLIKSGVVVNCKGVFI